MQLNTATSRNNEQHNYEILTRLYYFINNNNNIINYHDIDTFIIPPWITYNINNLTACFILSFSYNNYNYFKYVIEPYVNTIHFIDISFYQTNNNNNKYYILVCIK